MDDYPTKRKYTVNLFSIGKLHFTQEHVYLFNIQDAKEYFTCAIHKNTSCIKSLNKKTLFVLKPGYIDNEPVLLGDILSHDKKKYCLVGFIPCRILPKEAADALVGNIYQVDLKQHIDDESFKLHHGVLAGTYITRGTNAIIFNDYDMRVGY